MIGKPTNDMRNNRILDVSWDVHQFVNSPWALDPQSRWEVALTEVCLPKTFQMFPARLNPLSFSLSADGVTLKTYTLPENVFFQSPLDIVECLNYEMDMTSPIIYPDPDMFSFDEEESSEEEEATIKFKLCNYIQFHYDPHTLSVKLRLKFRPPFDMCLSFSDGLMELLNLEDDEIEIASEKEFGQVQRVVFSSRFNFTLLTDYIHILLEEADMSFINNKMTPWLYSCSIHPSSIVSHSHTHITIKPESPRYIPLNYTNSMKNNLHLSVVDNELNILKPQPCLYKHNDTLFHLHFRNIIPGR